ncbi:MAG: DUF5711 family protein [Oscillospiraceae bacterium]|nr:DUF5711 family protein [Oscillospiraceae bacterium]
MEKKIMNKAVDFDKVRKRRQRAVTLKRLLLLTGAMILAGSAVFVYNVLVEESATTGLMDYFESRGGTGFPVDLPGGVIRDVVSIGENLAVLNDTNLIIYNKNGKIIQNIQRMTEHSIAETSHARVLAFSVGGRNFSVHSISREMFSQSLDQGILCGDMGANGDFAVVAPAQHFASRVTVYDRQFRQIYSWSSPEYVTNVSLSPRGDMMAVSCVTGGETGVMKSLIYLFRFAEDRDQAEVALTLEDSLCLGLDFMESDRIALFTDKEYMILNQQGEIKETYDFGSRRLLARENSGRWTLLFFERPGRYETELVLLDESLKETASMAIHERIFDVAFGKDVIYLLTEDGITGYDHQMQQVLAYERHGISRIHLIGTRLYYLTYSQICVLG